jgi:hypothetical protein
MHRVRDEFTGQNCALSIVDELSAAAASRTPRRAASGAWSPRGSLIEIFSIAMDDPYPMPEGRIHL